MSYFIHTDLISSLLDPRLVDPGSTLVHTNLLLFVSYWIATIRILNTLQVLN